MLSFSNDGNHEVEFKRFFADTEILMQLRSAGIRTDSAVSVID